MQPNLEYGTCPTCGQSLIDDTMLRRVQRARATADRATQKRLRAEITAEVQEQTEAKYAMGMARMSARMNELQRQLDTQSAHDRGARHERDVCAALRESFPGDQIVRDGRGGDILHTVRQGEREIGLILYECKNAGSWQNAWLKKLIADGRRRQTPYLVLVTRKMPAKETGLCIRENIAVCEPAHVLAIASIMRRWVLGEHRAIARSEGVSQKAQRLYVYLAGESFRADFRAIMDCASELDSGLVAERDQHEKLWGRRAHLQEQLRTAHLEINAKLEEEFADDSSSTVARITRSPNGITRAA